MDKSALADELIGFVTGKPEYTQNLDPSSITTRVENIIISLFQEIGFNNIEKTKGSRRYIFDLLFQFKGQQVGVELKFGQFTIRDLNRLAILSEPMKYDLSKLIIISTSIDSESRKSGINEIFPVPLHLLSFNDFASIFQDPSGRGVREFLQDIQKPSLFERNPEINDAEIINYMRNTFGEEFWKRISKNDTAMEIFRHTKGFLGTTGATIILTGTTHTGKSTILNTLFGDKVAKTASYTDVTGQIAKIVLPNGLIIYDTPGVGGLNDTYENVTRAFLDIPQINVAEQVTDIPLVDLKDPSNPIITRVKPVSPTIENIVILLVFDLVGGFKRSDYELLNLIRARYNGVVLVGNKRDKLERVEDIELIKEDLKKRAFQDFIPVRGLNTLDDPAIGIDDLVKAICYQLSENAISTFNIELHEKYKRDKNELITSSIKRVAARASLVQPEEAVPGTKIPVHKALLLGLIIRLGIDYNIGGNRLKSELQSTIRDVLLHVTDKSTEVKIEIKKSERNVKKWKDRAVGGMASGATIGGLLGAVFGPVGMIFGAFFGGLFGGITGASTKISEIVKEIWNTPNEELIELPGGAEAAIVIMAFGYALCDDLEKIETGKSEGIDIISFPERINNYYKDISENMDKSDIELLNKGNDEQLAYRILMKVDI
jgi:GTP-binding protein EngB required for normal cell division